MLASYFPSSVDSLLPSPVEELSGLLSRESAHAVILAGGAALANRMSDAASMSGLTPQEQQLLVRDPRAVLPYLAELWLYPLNLGTAQFVFSVGCGGTSWLPVTMRRRPWSDP